MTALAVPPPVFGPVFTRLESDVARYFGVSEVALTTLEAHDRLYSDLARVSVHERRSQRLLGHVFVKVYKPKDMPGGPAALRQRVGDDFEATRHAHAVMQSHDHVGIVPPVACYPDLLAIVTEQVDGSTLLDHLEEHAAWFPRQTTVDALVATMARVGRWIRIYQTTGSSSRGVAIGELRSYVDHRLDLLFRRDGISAEDRAALLLAIETLGSDVRCESLTEVPIHADLALANVLICPERVVVLDFAMAKAGTRLHDLTRLYVQLDLLTVKPQFRRHVIGRLQQALVEGYDERLTANDPLFRILCLMHRVNHLSTLVVKPGSGGEALYNALVRHRHRKAIAREVAAALRTLERV